MQNGVFFIMNLNQNYTSICDEPTDEEVLLEEDIHQHNIQSIDD